MKEHRNKLTEVFDVVQSSVTGIKKSVNAAIRGIDDKHESIAAGASEVEKVTKVVAGVASVGALIAAPTGLAAVGVAIGITSAPLLVTAAPILLAIATTATTVSTATHFYSKSRRKRQAKESQQMDHVDD